MHAHSLGQARVNIGRRLVEVPTSQGNEPHSELPSPTGIERWMVSGLHSPAAVDPDLARSDDEHVSDARIGNERGKLGELGMGTASSGPSRNWDGDEGARARKHDVIKRHIGQRLGCPAATKSTARVHASEVRSLSRRRCALLVSLWTTQRVPSIEGEEP